MTIQDRLRNMKKIKASKATGLARAYVQLLSTNNARPSVRSMVKLADALGVSDAELGASVREWDSGHAANDNAAPVHAKPDHSESAEAVQ